MARSNRWRKEFRTEVATDGAVVAYDWLASRIALMQGDSGQSGPLDSTQAIQATDMFLRDVTCRHNIVLAQASSLNPPTAIFQHIYAYIDGPKVDNLTDTLVVGQLNANLANDGDLEQWLEGQPIGFQQSTFEYVVTCIRHKAAMSMLHGGGGSGSGNAGPTGQVVFESKLKNVNLREGRMLICGYAPISESNVGVLWSTNHWEVNYQRRPRHRR